MLYGLHPWHVYDLTAGEIVAYVDDLMERAKGGAA